MRRSAVALLAALLITGLAGCGSGSPSAATRHVASLCVDAGLPLHGSQRAAAEGFLSGFKSQLPEAGLTIGGYRIRLCRVYDDGADIVTHARQAAESADTIAYVGELSPSQAGVAEAVLAQAGIALITPTGPLPAPSAASVTGVAAPAAPSPPRSTALYLLPSVRTQSDSVAELRKSDDCTRHPGSRAACTVVSSTTTPLCTGIPPVIATTPRFCVLAGPDLSDRAGWTSPAVAYGDSAGRLLVASLRAIAARGDDVAERTTLLRTLSQANIGTSPIGAIRFDPAGGMEADLFTAYTVRDDGQLVPSGSFRAH